MFHNRDSKSDEILMIVLKAHKHQNLMRLRCPVVKGSMALKWSGNDNMRSSLYDIRDDTQ